MAALTYCLAIGVGIVFTVMITVSWCVHCDLQEDYLRTINRPDTIEDEEQREKT